MGSIVLDRLSLPAYPLPNNVGEPVGQSHLGGGGGDITQDRGSVLRRTCVRRPTEAAGAPLSSALHGCRFTTSGGRGAHVAPVTDSGLSPQYGTLLYQNYRIPPQRKPLLPSFSTPVVSFQKASQCSVHRSLPMRLPVEVLERARTSQESRSTRPIPLPGRRVFPLGSVTTGDRSPAILCVPPSLFRKVAVQGVRGCPQHQPALPGALPTSGSCPAQPWHPWALQAVVREPSPVGP